MTFGERVVPHRKQLKLSQNDLGKKVGTSAPIIGRYVRDEIKSSIETITKFADELGVNIDYLIAGSANKLLEADRGYRGPASRRERQSVLFHRHGHHLQQNQKGLRQITFL